MTVDIDRLQERVADLQTQLQTAQEELRQATSASKSGSDAAPNEGLQTHACLDNGEVCRMIASSGLPLHLDDYKRYGRQLILPEIGVQGQVRLKSSAVLLIGAGGLGCPAAAYLAGAGVGRIGIVDGDTVEVSNLHRQILYSTQSIGSYKAKSVKAYVQSLNPTVACQAYTEHLTSANAPSITSNYDVVIDCTDNPSSRYLISDTAVLLGKPLVLGSALRTEGQLVVLNHPVGSPGIASGGPCYRCVFPNPPSPENVMSCGEGGIFGPVVGIMGVMQAMEAIKIISSGIEHAQRLETGQRTDLQPSMLVLSAFDTPMFRSFKLRGRRKDCRTCSSKATITLKLIQTHPHDYAQVCGAALPADVLGKCERVKPTELAEILKNDRDGALVLDVREKAHYDVFHLSQSINLPYSSVSQWRDLDDAVSLHEILSANTPIHVLCRLGNDSQLAVRKLKQMGLDWAGQRYIGDVEGGWRAWRQDVEGQWPDY